MPVSKILTLSTAHISSDTRNTLRECCEGIADGSDLDWLPVYAKADNGENFGWFIYVVDLDSRQIANLQAVYPDLYVCMDYARKHGCDIICFDRDEEPDDKLDTYPDD